MKSKTCVLGLLALSLLVIGCGPSRPPRVPVSGVVLIDGKPLSQGTIQFHPESGRTAHGQIDGQGRFTLNCFEDGDGCVVGKNTVTVSATEAKGHAIRWLVPQKYMNPAESGLEFDIAEPTTDLKVELTWDGGKPFIEGDPSGTAAEAEGAEVAPP